jgi:DNA-binding winged helix-turn-helix (wHTH) protein/tetratricopeptide (TPR) repeat protein
MLLEMKHLKFGEFRLDEAARQLYKEEELVPLSGKVFDLLRYLVENPNRPLLKQELIQAIWPDSFVEEANLSQNIFVLRKALGEAGSSMIVTLPGRGYQFAAVVTEVPRLPEGIASGDVAVTRTVETTETRIVYQEDTEEHVPFWRSRVALGLSAVALVLAGIAGWLGWQRWEDHVGGPPVQVVIAEPDGSTGDPVLDRTLATVFRMELAQSPFVTVLSGANVRAKLAQMEHKPDDHLTSALAREICERTASQAVVHGSMAKAGKGFVLTEEATNCVDGASLGEASREVSQPDQLPGALAKLAAQIRHDLGESRRTIARFNHPLSPVTTGSLEALKDLTEAERLGALGRKAEANDLLHQAVAIDPGFAGAWLDLSTFALNDRETEKGRAYLQKAYDLRENAVEPTRRLIIARYNGEVTGDLYESLRNYQSWVDEYPRQGLAWSGMSVVYRTLGRNEEMLHAAQRTLDIIPTYQVVYEGLADAQVRTRDFAAARSTVQAALAKGFDGDTLRIFLLRLGYLTHDQSLVAEQEAWLREHPNSPYMIGNQALYAQMQGRSGDAARLLQVLAEVCHHAGQEELLGNFIGEFVVSDTLLGRPEEARKLMASMKRNPADMNYLYALTFVGDTQAESLLKEQLAANPRSTLWNDFSGRIMRGKMLLDQGKAREALAVLEPTKVFDSKDTDAIYLRGLANMELKQLPQAEAEFRKILDHPEINPTDFQQPLARLQFARVLALEGNKIAAVEAYRTFLNDWKNADSDAALLIQARIELQRLQILSTS